MSYFDQIATHARELPEEEVCGFVGQNLQNGLLEIVRQPNQAEKPKEAFVMPPTALGEVTKTHFVFGYYHSHPETGFEPSTIDKNVSEEVCLPVLTYSLKDDDLSTFFPSTYKPQLFNRPFCPLLSDCITLCEDYFLNDLKLPIQRVPRTWRNQRQFHAILPDYFQQNGFQFFQKPKIGDILVFAANGDGLPSHTGVLYDEGIFLHQRDDVRSAMLPFGGFWERVMCYCLRHKSRL